MAGSNFSHEEIERERRKATSRRANLDEERLQLMRDVKQIIETGTVEDLEARLEMMGKGTDTRRGRSHLEIYCVARRRSAVA
jgi:hypothetical protein